MCWHRDTDAPNHQHQHQHQHQHHNHDGDSRPHNQLTFFEHFCSFEFGARERDVGGIHHVCRSTGYLTALGARTLAWPQGRILQNKIRETCSETGHILPWFDKPPNDGGVPLLQ